MKETDHQYDVIVVGGGASGMMAAGTAAARGKRVLLLEKNAKLGEKLAISGGGRCNITNAEEDIRTLLDHYGDTMQFLFSPFSQFGVKDTFSFFESIGLPLKIEALKRAFPETEKAPDVVRVLSEYLAKGKVKVETKKKVESVIVKDGRIEKLIVGIVEYTAHSYVFATGGVSHPETGSTGDGFAWLRDLGHKIEKPTPTIVPLKTKEKWVKKLAGVAVPEMKITFFANGVKKFSRKGPILFTHFGVSGPTILNSAKDVADLLHEGAVTATIDVAPTMDIGTLDRQITEIFDKNKNKSLKNVFKEIAPDGTADVFLSLLPTVDPNIKVHSVTKEDRRKIVELLKSIPLTISGLMGFDRAVVADGGLPLGEIDTKTMRSKRVENLFVTGDLLHINRPSGGYSLQLCWTTGHVAGSHA